MWEICVSALYFQALGMPQEAIMCYQRALLVRPDYAMAFGKCAFLGLSFMFIAMRLLSIE